MEVGISARHVAVDDPILIGAEEWLCVHVVTVREPTGRDVVKLSIQHPTGWVASKEFGPDGRVEVPVEWLRTRVAQLVTENRKLAERLIALEQWCGRPPPRRDEDASVEFWNVRE